MLCKTYAFPNEFRVVEGFFLIYKTTYFTEFRREMNIQWAEYRMDETGTALLNSCLSFCHSWPVMCSCIDLDLREGGFHSPLTAVHSDGRFHWTWNAYANSGASVMRYYLPFSHIVYSKIFYLFSFIKCWSKILSKFHDPWMGYILQGENHALDAKLHRSSDSVPFTTVVHRCLENSGMSKVLQHLVNEFYDNTSNLLKGEHINHNCGKPVSTLESFYIFECNFSIFSPIKWNVWYLVLRGQNEPTHIKLFWIKDIKL